MRKIITLLLMPFLFCSSLTFAASATADNMLIIAIQQLRDDARGTNGRAFIYVDTNFTLPGDCKYIGMTTPALEIDTTHGSYKSILSLAMLAYVNGKKISAHYDDEFGSGTTCRLTGLQIHN